VQVQYKARFQRFAATLAELGPPVTGEPGPQATNLIPAALTSGYRTFYAGQNGAIRQNWSAEPASASSPELNWDK